MLAQALRETIRVQDRRVPLLEHHLERLRAGGCDSDALREAAVLVTGMAARWPHAYGRMTLQVERDMRLHAEVSDLPSSIAVEGGPVVALVETDIPSLPPGAAKPADREFWDRALAAAQAMGGHVALMVDHSGRLIDGSQATVWLVVGDGDGGAADPRLLTPPSPPALAGVSRAVVLGRLAHEIGVPAAEAELTVADYESAEEVVLTTAVAGAVAARARGGDVSRALGAAFERAFGVAGEE